MIGLSTNVLVRYLVEDDEDQAARARALLEGAADRGEQLYVGQVVLCELVWVLGTAYGRPRTDIVDVLKAVLRTAQFIVEDVELAHRALARFGAGGADFADYIVAERAIEAGCETAVTFDKELLGEDGFVQP